MHSLYESLGNMVIVTADNHSLTAGIPNSQTRLWRNAETQLLSRRRFRGRRKFNPSSTRNSGMCKRRAARFLKLRIPVLSLLVISLGASIQLGTTASHYHLRSWVGLQCQCFEGSVTPICMAALLTASHPTSSSLSASSPDLQARGCSTANDAITLPL
ncbi:hypothetical protein EDC04DRAFT_449603 [Pisolithus marmoratus]|nr:hypothetical protein EDC04DRAFT_449603 [Pisolithus marmoratus]